jgi:hypothetical protein
MIDFVKRKHFWFAFILIVFLFFIVFRPQTKADLVYFYPQTCLGSFVNPEKAQGEREVNSPDLINELNSAVYYSGFKEIYCGNFQGPIKEGEIKKVILHFNWVITKELREKPIIESTSSESLIEKIIPSKTIEINVGTSNIPINETQNNTNTNDTLNNTKNNDTLKNTKNNVINTNINEVNQTNGNEPTNTNGNESQTATSSQIFNFINFVFAQDEIENNTPRTRAEHGSGRPEANFVLVQGEWQRIEDTNTNESQTTTSFQIGITISESTQTQTTSTFTTSAKTLFDIHYTLDGQNWNYLGSVNENNWQNLSFEIPVAEASLRYGASPKVEPGTRPKVSLALLQGWLDISKIQIKINSYPDTDYYLYLESMWLEVDYVSKVEEITPEDTSILNKNLSLDQNVDYLKIIKIKGISNNKILSVLNKGELWFLDLIKEKQVKISDDIDVNFDIGIKVNHAFWLSKDRNKVYYMNLNSLTIKEKTLERADFSQRIYLPFPDLNLTLVLEGNNLYFQIPQIGEVFSDENSIVKDNFIRVFGLNKLLNEEELDNLGYYENSSE